MSSDRNKTGLLAAGIAVCLTRMCDCKDLALNHLAAHKTFGDQVEQEAADEFAGIEGHGLLSVPVDKGDFSVMG